ncbi:MAG: hypothetical protein QOD94_1174 [Alphaproteobacteria bacterium]|nr:hypothetical protein [Alphaproteobacteria bacterium]
MRSFASPVVGYVSAVLGVIAIASVAVFTMHGVAAKAHRHWDADIDRIIAQQQAKKLDTEATVRAEASDDGDARPQTATLTRGAAEDDDEDDLAFSTEEAKSKKLQNPGSKKNGRRTERRSQHYIPAAFATVPKFAASAAATSTVLLRLR